MRQMEHMTDYFAAVLELMHENEVKTKQGPDVAMQNYGTGNPDDSSSPEPVDTKVCC